MSKEIITEARALCEKATRGPWEQCVTDVWRGDRMVVENVCNRHDAAFIARSRTLIPELCDALESYKSFADRIAKLPDCNDCASNRDCPYLPNWGTTTRINCPLHKPLPAPPEKGQPMNEIEQAIKYLQPIADSATVGHYGDMLGIALAALREQAEREKGCEYCNNESHIRNKVDTLEFADGTIRDDKGLTVSIATTVKKNKPMVFVDICNYENDLQFGFAANFCPMCGKRLEVKHEDD